MRGLQNYQENKSVRLSPRNAPVKIYKTFCETKQNKAIFSLHLTLKQILDPIQFRIHGSEFRLMEQTTVVRACTTCIQPLSNGNPGSALHPAVSLPDGGRGGAAAGQLPLGLHLAHAGAAGGHPRLPRHQRPDLRHRHPYIRYSPLTRNILLRRFIMLTVEISDEMFGCRSGDCLDEESQRQVGSRHRKQYVGLLVEGSDYICINYTSI